LGEFSETFRFKLEGSTELIPLRFKGHVTAPKFRFEPDILNLGDVPFSFPQTKTITLVNLSPVSFRFSLRIPEDGKYGNEKEFQIHPARDVINKDESRQIEVHFTSQKVKKYDLYMVIDIENVGRDIESINILAESFVPDVMMDPSDKLDFEKVYLRNPNHKTFTLRNMSKLPARFEI
jgi:hydrocephalus-inducing protein